MTFFKRKINGELKGPSLTVKWAFASSFFIFVVCTIFAVVTYKSSISLMVNEEKKNVERTVSQVGNRLGGVEKLTVSEVYNKLKSSEPIVETLINQELTVDDVFEEMSSLLSELSDPSLSLTIYDTSETLVFKNQEEESKLATTSKQDATIQTFNGKNGFLLIQPVYSRETREKIGYIQIFYELASFHEIRGRLLFTFMILELVSLLLSGLLGLMLSTYFLKPLKLLRDTMDTIRNNPQSDILTPDIHSNDELADLSEIFNEMLDRMRKHIEQQEQFVEDVSHELRTPVAIIEGHLNLLNRWGKNDAEILDESLEASLQEIVRMKSLVQEMLDLSRAEQVDTHYSNYTCQAKQVVYQVFNNFRLVYPDFVITLDDDLFEEATLKIYRNHFEQLLIIILDNAVKYSTFRKEVHISISKTLNEFEIAIQDFGEGISREDLDKIFNRFYRVDKARARNKGGNGLGLSIAKQLVENYKGKIEVDSAIRQGTIFRISLPIDELDINE